MLTSFLGWVLRTVTTAAEAEMNDDGALREQLLEAGMRRETGEITEEEFREREADLLARIREVRARRAGGSGPLTMSGQAIDMSEEGTFQVEASVAGDFHDPSAAPHTTIVQAEPGHVEEIAVLDLDSRRAIGTPRSRKARTSGKLRKS